MRSFAPTNPVRRLSSACLAVGLIIGCQAGGPTTAPTQSPTLVTQAPTQAPTAPPTATPAPEFPVTLIDDEGTEVELEAEPQRVVSLTPATSELLFALGEGDKLVGRTEFDDYPAEVADVPAVASFTGVVIEAVVDQQPDLILAGGNFFTPPADVTRLRELGYPVLVLYAEDLAGVNADIMLVGQAVGAHNEAADIVAGIDARVNEVTTAVAGLGTPRTFYEIGYEPEIYAPADGSFIADMVVLGGGDAITTGDPVAFSISLEQLVDQDPEVIVLGDAAYPPITCPDAVAAREGWDEMTAVVEGNVRPVNDIIVTRPGPRIGEGLADLALAIHPDAAITPPIDSGAALCPPQ